MERSPFWGRKLDRMAAEVQSGVWVMLLSCFLLKAKERGEPRCPGGPLKTFSMKKYGLTGHTICVGCGLC